MIFEPKMALEWLANIFLKGSYFFSKYLSFKVFQLLFISFFGGKNLEQIPMRNTKKLTLNKVNAKNHIEKLKTIELKKMNRYLS